MSAGGFRGRATVLVVLAGILALALSGCVSKEDSTGAVADASVDPAQLAGLTLRVGDQKGGTESLMRAAGELDSLPFKVEFSTFTSGPPEIEAATAGKIDFAVTGNTPPIFGAASNAKIKIVSAYTNNAGGDVILVPAGSTLTSVEQLKGKKVAVAKGSSAHGNLLEQLSKANLKLGTDVTPVFLQPADALSAFSSGAVDAWAIWDPYTAIVQKDSGAKILASGTGVVNGYGFGIASNEALADAKRNTALRIFVEHLAKASKWASANVETWSQQYAKAIGIDPQAALAAQQRSVRPAIEIDDTVVASEQKLADAFAAAGQLDHKPVIADFVDKRFNSTVAPYAVSTQ
ncbi:aliphatic sulfonate ABC transporter substrate binding protein [Gordonia polyisoprenivorans NBRC 16320 = JCM 10675]|uniref:Putative aliphatic sulfonates-binding protein n=1 Tax=Gordonia polyisoprenivorans TaxID=84595 RepID=A0A846WGU4_9ACTN|nr:MULTISPECIES: ABC transporter substrate-binding protein [Gordonia]MDF3280799.1 ABC transporter substrate-binding protein [Gordonia sp. N1V]NKY00167.1 ABC transporter substrate-binding protein [Gordonia polyisoprenivorans]OPX11760.1 ABC transporter substrate-binding protein [Gordonia sp. i37]OZC33831.1 aliphatic sulfonates ABC transporter substrate-binding protein [Gordonia polyisoprenivorans]QUD81915.1 ABC transporter substrate-binding protein [Gordonia polyisoprenivorans]